MSRQIHPLFVVIVTALTFSAELPAQEARIRVTSAEEMPHHTYSMTGSASELVQNDVQFAAFAKRLEADLRADLTNYEIADRATLKRFYGTLSSLALLMGFKQTIPPTFKNRRNVTTWSTFRI